MAITPAEIAHLASLARIELTDDELAELAPQLDVILDAVAQVSEVAAPDVAPTTHALDLANVFRPDVVRESLSTSAALSGAPDQEDGKFRVPHILGEE